MGWKDSLTYCVVAGLFAGLCFFYTSGLLLRHVYLVNEASKANADVEEEERNALINLGRQELQQYFRFPLDDWQLHAGGAICSGYNVIVCAPTGAGKHILKNERRCCFIQQCLKFI